MINLKKSLNKKNIKLNKVYYNLSSALNILTAFGAQNKNETLNLTIFLYNSSGKNKKIFISDTVKLPHPIKQFSSVLIIGNIKLESNNENIIIINDNNIDSKLKEISPLILNQTITNCICEIGYEHLLKKFENILKIKNIYPKKQNINILSRNIITKLREFDPSFIKYKSDKFNCINIPIGKLHFTELKLEENIKQILMSIIKQKPSHIKGNYINKYYLSSTTGPSLEIKLTNFNI